MIRILSNYASFFIFIFIVLFIYIFVDLFILKNLKVEVIPDLTDKQVIIYTEYLGQTPQIIHDQVSYVIASNMMGLPGVKSVKSFSMPNFSLVYVIFNDNIDLYYARNRVLERLSTLNLPEGIKPILGPDATGVGWAYQYVITSNTKNLSELWDFQNFYLKYLLLSLPNVSEVASVGGYEKEFRIFINPYKLYQYKIELQDIVKSIEENNISGSGKYIEISEKQVLINTNNGYIKNINDIMKIKINDFLRLKDIGYITYTPSLRMGVADYNGQGEVVGGIVILRYQSDTYKTIQLIKQKINEISKNLKDVTIIPVYDRSILIEETIKGLFKDITKEMIITIAVVLIFLYSIRGSVIISFFILFSTLIGLFIFNLMGINSNLMSLGGVILAIGTMIDAAIVIIENYYRTKNNYLLLNTYLVKLYPIFLYNIFLKTDYKRSNNILTFLSTKKLI
jgi:Cu(I)/Ag(I) efflux system membrane protein CusA/SilA